MIFGLIVIFIVSLLIIGLGEKRGFFAFFSLCLVGCQYSISGPLTIEDVLLLVFLILALTNNNVKKKIKGYPLGICTALYSISVIVSAIYTKVNPHYGMAFVECLRTIVLPLLFFYYVRTLNDIKIVVKLIVGVVIFGILLSIMAEILQTNLYLDFIRKFTATEVGWDRIDEERFGFFRAQAFCLQPVSYGYICVTILSVFFFFLDKYLKQLNISTIVFTFTVSSCVIGCLLSGSRSGILPLGICLILYYGRKKFSGRNMLIGLFLLAAIFVLYGKQLDIIWNSIFMSDEDRMGSSSEMRLNQMDISLFYFQKSPIVGLGTNAIFDFVGDIEGEAIHGGESVWFKLLINQGLLGCITYALLYVSSFSYIKKLKFNVLLFLFIQLLIKSITSTPGYDVSITLCFVLLAGAMEKSGRMKCKYR